MESRLIVFTPAASQQGEGFSIAVNVLPQPLKGESYTGAEHYAQHYFSETIQNILNITHLKTIYEGYEKYFLETLVKYPLIGTKSALVQNINNVVYGYGFATIKVAYYVSNIRYIMSVTPKVRGIDTQKSQITIPNGVLYGSQSQLLYTLFPRHRGLAYISSLLSRKKFYGSKGTMVFSPRVFGKGSETMIRDVQTVNTIVAPDTYKPQRPLQVYYIGANDSQPVLYAMVNGVNYASATMSSVGDGVFVSNITAPLDGVLALKVVDQKYMIFAVKTLEKEVNRELKIQAVYNPDTYFITAIIMYIEDDSIKPFWEEDVVFVELRSLSGVLDMANIHGTGETFVTYSSQQPPQVFIVKASYLGKQAFAVVGSTQSAESTTTGIEPLTILT